MKAIIVDDEPRAISLLEGYLQHFQAIEVVATFRNGLKAFDFLQKDAIDLVFLDINMPHLSGLSLAKMIPTGTQVIFTTAYSEFAVESYEVNAVDYLLKPISFERFSRAVSKLMPHAPAEREPKGEVLLLKSGSNIHRVAPEQILFLEKDGNYLYCQTPDRRIMTRQSVGEALAQLPAYFLQVHKSFIVNVRQIDYFNKQEIVIGEQTIPIGQAFKEAFRRGMQEER